MLHVPPKKVLAKKTKKRKAKLFSDEELDEMLTPSAIKNELQQMRKKGVLPSQKRSAASIGVSQVIADLVDAVRWQQSRREELRNRQIQDIYKEEGWIDELMEDFIAFEISPANTPEEAGVIIDQLDAELIEKSKTGYGPEARNYIAKLRKELQVLRERL